MRHSGQYVASVLVLLVGPAVACAAAWQSEPAAHSPAAAAETVRNVGTVLGSEPPATRLVSQAAKPVAINAFPSPDRLGGDWLYFPETGHYLAGGFKTYFERNGGLATFGYPITEELTEDGWTVQYFQRARLEFHPEAPAAPIQRSLLGDMLLAVGQAAGGPRPSAALFSPPPVPPAGGRLFPETGHYVAPPALDFFDRNGGPATFGYPISQPAGAQQWFQRARLEWISEEVQPALIGDEYATVAGLSDARARAQPPEIARANLARIEDDLDVFASPGGTELVTRLPQDAQLRITGERRATTGELYFALRLWNAVDGYVKPDRLAFTPAPAKPPGAGGSPWKPAKPPARGPLALEAFGRLVSATDFAATPDGPAIGRLSNQAQVRVTGWATDEDTRPWYRFEAGGGQAGWVTARAVSLETGLAAGGAPVQRVAGKGMWFTYDTLRQTPAQHLVAAAQANGLSFLAPEVGTSRRGYWAGKDLDNLIMAAHAAGLSVIPWVYPWLVDLPADLELALRAARHTTAAGETVDGLAIDIEETLDEPMVRTYGELLRHAVGPDRLLIALVYQPQIASGRRTPYETLARSFDVLGPMSYWHTRPVGYTEKDAYDYVAESVQVLRQRARRPDLPVAVLGQTFDWFTRNEIGPGNPSAAELNGAMRAARDAGALGIGFFNWYSTTPEEWDAIGAFSW